MRDHRNRYLGVQTLDIDNTLEERGSRYGSFDEHARIAQNIKRAMADSPNWAILEDDMKEALEMVAHKAGRILNGDPNYTDSWHDIIGYIRLVEKRLCQADTIQSTLSSTRKPRSKSKSEKPETRLGTISNEPEKSTRETGSTSTIDTLLRRVEETNRLIGGSVADTPTDLRVT